MNGLKKPVKTLTENMETSSILKTAKRENFHVTGEVILEVRHWEPFRTSTSSIFIHVFHKKQPDLNWENPKVREEVYKNINWWLDKGLGGFRIDAIINIKKKLPYKDYMVDRDDNLSCIDQMLADAKGVGEFLGEMRDKTFKPHNAFTSVKF